MSQRLLSLLRISQLPLLLMATMTFPESPNALIGIATGLHLLLRSQKQIARAVIATIALIFFSAWLPLPVACLLASMYAVEALLADTMRMRAARLFSAALCLQIILFVLVKEPTLFFLFYQPALALTIAVAALLCGGREFSKKTPLLDPLLCALAFFLFLSFALAVAWLAQQLNAYTPALAGVTAIYAAVLAAVSILVGPLFQDGKGYESVAQAFALDVPLEKWVDILSTIAGREQNADDFLRAAARRMLQDLPGVIGLEWRVDGKSEKLGSGKLSMQVSCPPLDIIFYRQRFATPWTWFAHYLVCRVVSEYYLSKRREEEQRARNLLYAVHQTGARITHDIKNILHILSAIASVKNPDLLSRHIPTLKTRLETALGKLHVPNDDAKLMPAAAWWDEAQFRHTQTHEQQIHFASAPTELANVIIPSTLFDRALDNFIENAMRKTPFSSNDSTNASTNNRCAINVSLSVEQQKLILNVTDNGDAVNPQTVKNLFSSPVSSADGFGVALYQLAEEATRANYQVILQDNTPGHVTFSLLPISQQAPQ